MKIDLDEERINAEVAIDSICSEAYILNGCNLKEYVLEDSQQCLEVLNKIKDYVEDAIWNIEFEIEHIGD